MGAAMSSLSSAINSLSAVTVEDIQRLRKTPFSNTEYLRNAKIAGVGWGLVTLILSFYAGDIAPTVIEAINKIGSVFYGPVLATFIAGIHLTRISGKAANIGLITGVLVNVAFWLSGSPIFWFWWNLIGFVVTLGVGVIASQRFPNDTDGENNLTSVIGINRTTALLLASWSVVLCVICLFVPDAVLSLR